MHADELTRRWPAVRVEPNVLYTDDGQILTSAGAAAGLDLCLHIVRHDHGIRIANTLARRLVIPPQMRTHFARINHVTPHAYQRTFRPHAAV
jgi:AraC family transcriptional activator FtrA